MNEQCSVGLNHFLMTAPWHLRVTHLRVEFTIINHNFAMGFPRLSRFYPQINRLGCDLCINSILTSAF